LKRIPASIVPVNLFPANKPALDRNAFFKIFSAGFNKLAERGKSAFPRTNQYSKKTHGKNTANESELNNISLKNFLFVFRADFFGGYAKYATPAAKIG